MKIKQTAAVFFSATQTTERITGMIAQQLPVPVEYTDITGQDAAAQEFSADTLLLIGMPVYGGRIPAPAAARLKALRGKQTPVVLIAVYGNRAYEDALLEMKDIVCANGFIPIAAAACIAEHSIMHSVAKGRPDTQDEQKIHDFAIQVWEKISNAERLTVIEIPGNTPYRTFGGVPMKPHTTKSCTSCGVCAQKCPVGAIPMDAPSKTDKEVCISCMRCIHICPAKAREINPLILAPAELMFAKKNSKRCEPEFWLD